MKILWISRWDSRSPTDGQLLYTEGLIGGLKQCGVSIDVIASRRKDLSELLDQSGRNLFAQSPLPRAFSLLGSLQSDAAKQRTTAMGSAIAQAVAARPDAIVFDYFATGWALPIVQQVLSRTQQSKVLLVYVSHNHEGSLRRSIAAGVAGNALKRLVLKTDAEKAARLEARLVAAADIVTTNTDEDAELFRREAANKTYVTLIPAYSGPTRPAGNISAATPRKVVVMGSLVWIAKQESLRRFILAARDRFEAAGIELVVLGRSDPAFLKSIERMSQCVTVLGFVDDPLPHLHDARIGIMPDELGGGFKHRVFNYIFNGVPAATIRSQAAGLPLDLDNDLIGGHDVDDLVGRIIVMIDDVDALNAMAARALEKCREGFDWNSRGRALAEAISEKMRKNIA